MFDIYTIGAEVLRQKAAPVENFDAELSKTIETMFTTMKFGRGIGLAGPQVGIGQRLFVIQLEGGKPFVFINPEIIGTSQDLSEYEEGCLSIPGTYADLQRSASVQVQAYSERGRPFTMEADGLLARVIQHELDHLDGVLFTDRLPERVRERLLKQYEKRMRA
ncbi:MAG: peptide deformylase [Spirochaetales bacterium]|nr:peptide deformylase [Spirochaetales bacterium]MBP7264596.1 peptide deformylase [Spirochaetia bacterium]